MKKITLALAVFALSSIADAKCLHGQFEVDMAGESWQTSSGTVDVTDGKAVIDFQMELSEDQESAQFVSRIVNANEVVKTESGAALTVGQIFRPDHLVMKREAVRCPCLVYATDDWKVIVDFKVMNDDAIERINYFGFENTPVKTLSVAEKCE